MICTNLLQKCQYICINSAKRFALIVQSNLHLLHQEICTNGAKYCTHWCQNICTNSAKQFTRMVPRDLHKWCQIFALIAKIFALIVQSNIHLWCQEFCTQCVLKKMCTMVPRDLHQWCQTFALIANIFALIVQSNLHLLCQEICTNGAKEIAATVPRRRDPTGCGVVARLQISPSRKNRHHH